MNTQINQVHFTSEGRETWTRMYSYACVTYDNVFLYRRAMPIYSYTGASYTNIFLHRCGTCQCTLHRRGTCQCTPTQAWHIPMYSYTGVAHANVLLLRSDICQCTSSQAWHMCACFLIYDHNITSKHWLFKF